MKKWIKQNSSKVISEIAGAVMVVENHNNPKIAQARLDTCNECEYLDKDFMQCKVCLCMINKKIHSQTNRGLKGRTELTHCPRGKWGDKVLANIYRQMDGKQLL